MKIGFIGAGNMASAIVRGTVRTGAQLPEHIFVFDIDRQKTDALQAELGVQKANDVAELIAQADAVVLAVKPNVFPSLLPAITSDLAKKDPLIVSIAAGKTIEYIQDLLSYSAAIVRIMPNINATVGAAMSAYCHNDRVTKAQKEFVETLCRSFGEVMHLDERMFPLFGVLAGCAPAYSYMFIDALARAGVKNGMPKQEALHIAAQTVLGSAKQILESDQHPWELVDRVCSPGGTTIEGVAALQQGNFDATIANAVQAALDKDKKI